ncbi:hypothetical protein [Actinomycetospora sp.]|jgi:hypothetical protein|uniref:hypothetical protein n=1 Tax=Actinomycetospora sp. TaxID=1872135 RepID=UPI002F42C2F0
MGWQWRTAAVLAAVMGLLVGGVTLHESRPRPSQALTVGATLTQYSADAWNPPPATDRAKEILRRVTGMTNQHIMGWGVLNPSPAPGQRDWASLDARVRLMGDAGVTPVVTLCCAPDWMKGGRPGQTDWNRLEVAPDRAHFADFVQLAVDVAKRYPQVKQFVVWNELKGFYDPGRGRWNIEAYTDLYNQVYRALKAYDPSISVGGPYVPMDSWEDAPDPSSISGPWGTVDQRALDAVQYWLAHAVGADFLAVDGSNGTKDKGLITSPEASNAKFAAITRWLVAQANRPGRPPLPVWWMELHADVAPSDNAASPYAADVALDALLQVGDAGADAVFLWQPEADPRFHSVALWDSTSSPNGGRPEPLVARLEEVENSWAAGDQVTYVWRDRRLVLTPTSP